MFTIRSCLFFHWVPTLMKNMLSWRISTQIIRASIFYFGVIHFDDIDYIMRRKHMALSHVVLSDVLSTFSFSYDTKIYT